MKKLISIILLIIMIIMSGCSTSNIPQNGEETELNKEEKSVSNVARIEGTDIVIEWMPKMYENEQFKKNAEKQVEADELVFSLLNIDIQAYGEKYNNKATLIFTNMHYTESTVMPTMTFSIVNKTGKTIENIKFFIAIESKNTGQRYVEVGGGLEGLAAIEIPTNTAYYYSMGFPAAVEQPIGTKFGQKDVNVYVENLTYDVIE